MGWASPAAAGDKMRARVRDLQNAFRALPKRTRWGFWVGLEVVLVAVVGAVDLSLGVGLAVVITILWVQKIEDDRAKLAVEAIVVVLLLLVEPPAGIGLAIGFA